MRPRSRTFSRQQIMAAARDLISACLPAFLLLFLHLPNIECTTPYDEIIQHKQEYVLPELPYRYDGLEPFIDEATMRVHHLGHHAAYTNKLNAALKSWRESGDQAAIAAKPIIGILHFVDFIHDNWREKIKNNGGGYVNHALYWAIMSPNPNNEERRPSDRVAQLIDESFGSFSEFQKNFEKNALTLFGSGYTWLCFDIEEQRLKIINLSNQDSPFSHKGLYPILVIDLWEHAYYLKHQNRRAAYVQGFWNVINWDAVSELLEWWPKQARHDEL